MAEDSYYATGRRKASTAKVRLKMGEGKIIINDREMEDYFRRDVYNKLVREPLELVDFLDKFDAEIEVKGGGLTGQAGAIRLGLARVISKINPELRQTLKKAGMLRRDPRMKERKKPGLRGARAKPQSSKR
ncbi:30S ribosomal protein S9 [Candidatus Aerophobetes bacterium]|nr:30S ribosomal protein S9 [Candidatus Aerophobetes bacterium]